MKKILSVLVIAGVVAGFTGCGKGHKAEAKRQAAAADQLKKAEEARLKAEDAAKAKKAEEERLAREGQTFEMPKLAAKNIGFLAMSAAEARLAALASEASMASNAEVQQKAGEISDLVQMRADRVCKYLGLDSSLSYEDNEMATSEDPNVTLGIELATIDENKKEVIEKISITSASGSPTYFSKIICKK